MGNNDIPQIDSNPKPCPICDTTLTLGLLTGLCEGEGDPAKKGQCLAILKPLEDGKMNASDAIAEAIVVLGDDDVNSIVDRMNLLIYSGTAKAKERLIADGVLRKDGSPKE